MARSRVRSRSRSRRERGANKHRHKTQREARLPIEHRPRRRCDCLTRARAPGSSCRYVWSGRNECFASPSAALLLLLCAPRALRSPSVTFGHLRSPSVSSGSALWHLPPPHSRPPFARGSPRASRAAAAARIRARVPLDDDPDRRAPSALDGDTAAAAAAAAARRRDDDDETTATTNDETTTTTATRRRSTAGAARRELPRQPARERGAGREAVLVLGGLPEHPGPRGLGRSGRAVAARVSRRRAGYSWWR